MDSAEPTPQPPIVVEVVDSPKNLAPAPGVDIDAAMRDYYGASRVADRSIALQTAEHVALTHRQRRQLNEAQIGVIRRNVTKMIDMLTAKFAAELMKPDCPPETIRLAVQFAEKTRLLLPGVATTLERQLGAERRAAEGALQKLTEEQEALRKRIEAQEKKPGDPRAAFAAARARIKGPSEQDAA